MSNVNLNCLVEELKLSLEVADKIKLTTDGETEYVVELGKDLGLALALSQEAVFFSRRYF